jgi:hypothetical protein
MKRFAQVMFAGLLLVPLALRAGEVALLLNGGRRPGRRR